MTDNLDVVVANEALRLGCSPAELHQLIAKGRAWLVSEAARLKADPRASSRQAQRVLSMARAAWKLAPEDA